MKPKSSFFTDEGGSVALMLVVMMFVVVGLLAFVIDLAHIKTVKTELSNAGDACALRGARAFYADARPFKEPADDVRAIAEAKIAIGDNYSDKGLVDTPLQNINDDDIEVGVWNFETRQWLYVAGEQPVFTWPPNAEDYGKVIGPGIGLKIRREEGVNHGPVMMTMARIFQIGSVNVNAPAIAALMQMIGVTPISVSLLPLDWVMKKQVTLRFGPLRYILTIPRQVDGTPMT